MQVNNLHIKPDAPNQHEQIRRKIEQDGPEGFAKMLEGVLIQQMLQQMNKSMLSNGLFGKNNQGQMFQGMFTQAMAENIAENGGLGLAEIITNDLSGIDESSVQGAGQASLEREARNDIPLDRKKMEAHRNQLLIEPEGKNR